MRLNLVLYSNAERLDHELAHGEWVNLPGAYNNLITWCWIVSRVSSTWSARFWLDRSLV